MYPLTWSLHALIIAQTDPVSHHRSKLLPQPQSSKSTLRPMHSDSSKMAQKNSKKMSQPNENMHGSVWKPPYEIIDRHGQICFVTKLEQSPSSASFNLQKNASFYWLLASTPLLQDSAAGPSLFLMVKTWYWKKPGSPTVCDLNSQLNWGSSR